MMEVDHAACCVYATEATASCSVHQPLPTPTDLQQEGMHVVALVLLPLLFDLPRADAQFNYSRYQHETWYKISKPDNIFSARNGHATTLFKKKVWLIGGRTAEYETWNLQSTERNADVWSSDDGAAWVKQAQLMGDFEVQNFDVKVPGPIAPWYARYGHTVDAMDITGDGVDDIMVLVGGFTPQPLNDVWITEDGVTWRFVDYGPWSGRAWHASAVYNNSLYILGGTPLNNEVWAGTVVKNESAPFKVWYGRAYLNTSWHVSWRSMSEIMSVPWSPRAGHKAVVQCKYAVGPDKSEYIDAAVKKKNSAYPETFAPFCLLYVIGGYGGLNESFYYYNGLRSLNDVWITRDGVNWTAATHAAPWGPRAFHDVVVWANYQNITQDAAAVSRKRSPRIWMAGGGYMGMKDNNIVYMMKGYVDLWWTRDGATWQRVDWEQGSGSDLFSTNTWARTEVSGSSIYLGKWGHRLLRYRRSSADDAMYFMAGTHGGSGDKVRDVWKSTKYVWCDQEGVTCSGEVSGYCGEGVTGCVCGNTYTGEYCQHIKQTKSPAARGVDAAHLLSISSVLMSCTVLWLTLT